MSIFEQSKSYRPFKYPKMVEAEVKHRVDMHWSEVQVDLADDLRQYHAKDGLAMPTTSHENNQAVLEKLLPLFTEMDNSVGAGYAQLLAHVKNNECRMLLMTTACREVTHARGYALANETFGFPESSWASFWEYQEMSEKIDLLRGDCGDLSEPVNWCKLLGQILLGEGIALFGSFACLLNFKRFGLLMGFNDVNSWSLADEDDHVNNNLMILAEARKDLSPTKNEELNTFLVKVVHALVDAEHKFIELLMEEHDIEDITEEDLKAYITYLGQLRLYQLGLIGSLDVPENPLKWMEWMLSGSKHDNFFEKRVTDYSHNGLQGEIDYSNYHHILVDKNLS